MYPSGSFNTFMPALIEFVQENNHRHGLIVQDEYSGAQIFKAITDTDYLPTSNVRSTCSCRKLVPLVTYSRHTGALFLFLNFVKLGPINCILAISYSKEIGRVHIHHLHL